MIRVMATVATVVGLGGCGSVKTTPVATGPLRIDSDRGSVESRFVLKENESGDKFVLIVDVPISSTVWSVEIGQTRPTAVYSKYLPSIGHVLVIESEEGASMLRLTLIRLFPEGGSEIIYDNHSRFGWNIVDLDGDFIPEIIQTSGDLGGKKTILISHWDGEKFTPKNAFSSAGFAEYEIVIHP